MKNELHMLHSVTDTICNSFFITLKCFDCIPLNESVVSTSFDDIFNAFNCFFYFS